MFGAFGAKTHNAMGVDYFMTDRNFNFKIDCQSIKGYIKYIII